MKAPRAKCDFCDELSGEPGNAFHRIYAGTPESRVLFRSNHFAVIPSLGQIVEGYLLVLPIRHLKAVGDLPSTYVDEFVTICDRVGKILKGQYGSYILFEHGTRSEGLGGCGIYHAHLHATPLVGVLDPVGTLMQRFRYTELTQLSEIGQRSAGLSSYLFYQDTDARLYLFDTGPIPSQYMRKLLADTLGAHDWDWRTAEREERLLATIQRLSGQFDSTQEFAHAPNA